jgi:hypothetical protein
MTDEASKGKARSEWIEIPIDAEARRQWAEEFVDDLMNHPHDEETTWTQRERPGR